MTSTLHLDVAAPDPVVSLGSPVHDVGADELG